MPNSIDGHALVVGVADYHQINKLPKIVLQDACDVYAALVDPATCAYPKKQVKLLLNEQATRREIQEALASLAAHSGLDSVVFIYVSSHGGRIESGPDAGEYLLPVDTKLRSSSGVLQIAPETAISGQEFTEALRAIKAQKILVVFDCCHSGGIGQPKGTTERIFKSGFPESFYQELASGRGRVIMSSSRDDEESWILPGAKNSLFTQHLLAGLQGGAVSHDGMIRVFDLFVYIQPRVNQAQPVQHPIFKSDLEENFPVALSSGGQQKDTISMTNAPLRILHISDIHRAPNAPTTNDALFGALQDDLESYPIDNEKLSPDEPQLGKPDIIVVSGDLTQTGATDEYNQALLFLERLLPWVEGRRERVVVVPGNHDISWKLASQSYKKAKKKDYDKQEVSGVSARPLIKRATDNSYWERSLAAYNNRFKPFQDFFEKFYQGRYTYALESSRMFTVYDLPDLKTVIVGYNSCDEIDAYQPFGGKPQSLDRRGVISPDAIYNAASLSSFHKGEQDLLRIAVFHHNIRSVNWGEDFLDPKYLDILKKEGFDLCLHGHVHKPEHDLYNNAVQTRNLPVVGAGSLAVPYRDRPPATPMSYNLIVTDRVSKGIWVHTRRSDEMELAWKADYRWDGKPYFVARSPGLKAKRDDEEAGANRGNPPVDFCVATVEGLRSFYKTVGEARDLCLYMDRNYDDLIGEGRRDKLRELVRSLKTREELERLLQKCRADYPEGKWPELPPSLHACP